MHDTRIKLDQTDEALLERLQARGQATAQELGEALNLSASQAGRRKQRLEEKGVIQGYHARLDPLYVGLHIQAFIQVHLAHHGASEGAAFSRLIKTRREVTSAWAMTGDADYLLRVFCPDLPALNRLIHEVLLADAVVARVHSQIVMDQPKADAPLPIG